MVEPEIKHYHGNDGSDDSSDEEMSKLFNIFYLYLLFFGIKFYFQLMLQLKV